MRAKSLLICLGVSWLSAACLDFQGAAEAYCSKVSCAQGCCDGYSCQEGHCVADASVPDAGPDAGEPSDAGTVLDTTITSGPNNASGPNPQFQFTSSEPATFQCILEPAETTFTACVSPKQYSALPSIAAPGYLFRVRAKLATGAVDPTPAEFRFSVTPGPTVVITAPTDGSTVGISVVLTFNMESGVSYTCQLDSGPVVNGCTSGHVFAGLSSIRTHALKVTATDSDSRTATQTVTFTVDDTGPAVAVSGIPAAGLTVNTTTANLTFSPLPANEPSPFSFQCQFDAAPTFTTCTGLSVNGLIEGTHALQVRGLDHFGNIGPVTTYAWTVVPLTTSIFAIRTTPIAAGTRVKLGTAIRVSGRTNDRFWVQEGTAANRGITIRPSNYNSADANLTPGRSLTVIGTVAQVSFNATLVDASYTAGSLQVAYGPGDSARDSLNLLEEGNEGMLIKTAGRPGTLVDVSCSNYDFCIVSCERATPLIYSIDGIIIGSLVLGRDGNFVGIVEGVGPSSYSYYVIDAQEQSDACL